MSRFCTECGYSIKQEEQFCPSCGTEFIEKASIKKQQVIQNDVILVTSQPKKPLSTGKKVLFTSVFILFILLLASHFAIKSFTKIDKTAHHVYNALISNDSKELFDSLTLQKDSQYNEKAYMAYLNDQDMDNFLDTLLSNTSATAEDGIVRIIKHDDGTDLFRIQQSKFLFLYPIVQVIATSSNLLVETDLKDVGFSFNGKGFKLQGKNIDLGYFLPGNYTYEVTSKNPILPHVSKNTIFVDTNDSQNILSFIDKELQITLASKEKDSIVFINDLSTKKTIEELQKIGPVFGETEVRLHVEKKMPSGENAVSKEEVGLAGSEINFIYPSEVSFVVKTDEELANEKFNKNDLERFVLDFREAYSNSLNDQSFSRISRYLETDSSAYKELKKFVGDLGNQFYEYEFTVNEVTNVEVTINEAHVSTYEEFYFTNHTYDTVFYQRDKQYDIRLDQDGHYKIHKINIFETKRHR